MSSFSEADGGGGDIDDRASEGTTESTSSADFALEIENVLEANKNRVTMTDFEWDLRNRMWDEQKDHLTSQMLGNNVWNMVFQTGTGRVRGLEFLAEDSGEGEGEGEEGSRGSASVSKKSTSSSAKKMSSVRASAWSTAISSLSTRKTLTSSAMTNASKLTWKVPKMTMLELFRYLQTWDKASYGKRDRMIMEFIHTYDTKDIVYHTENVFANGGSLIFARFSVGLHICVLKHRRVWHYYDALGIFLRSLQSDRYAEEFLRMGGMNFIIQVVRVEETKETDKLRACHFLVNLMKSRSGHAVKQFLCDTPQLLEALVDSLTMCKNTELIKTCGLIFENLCIEITPANVPIICNFVMHALPCDFNPPLQAMSFRVLQGFLRLKPSLATKCIKPILDNLKTGNNELLISMGNLSLIIQQTKYGGDLITALMAAGEGVVELKEVFQSENKYHLGALRNVPPPEVADEIRKVREKKEEARLKQQKIDQYNHQAGALFILNYMMQMSGVEFVEDFVSRGIFGLSLKTLGSCPHWEVQGKGAKMVKFLFSVSMDCALSYYMMLPPRLLELILTQPEECLRYLTSPICVLLRKLGTFTLQMWPAWVGKVISVAKLYAKGAKIPLEVFELTQMSRKVLEIHQIMEGLLEEPVMEACPKTPPTAEDEIQHEFFESSDEENLGAYKDGQEVILGDDRFSPFRPFITDDSDDYKVSEDRLDIPLHIAQTENLGPGDQDDDEKDLMDPNNLSAMLNPDEDEEEALDDEGNFGDEEETEHTEKDPMSLRGEDDEAYGEDGGEEMTMTPNSNTESAPAPAPPPTENEPSKAEEKKPEEAK